MKVVVRQKADDDLDNIFDWISLDNPDAAVAAIICIRDEIHRLAIPGMHEMGRPGRDAGTRELVNTDYNVIIVYEIHAKAEVVEVLSIFSATQDR
jgi:plasmid stabilization system protein ParE